MIAGGAGMIAYALAVIPLLRRMCASRAASAALAAWAAATAVAAVPVIGTSWEVIAPAPGGSRSVRRCVWPRSATSSSDISATGSSPVP